MKKISILAVLLSAVLLLPGCGGAKTAEEQQALKQEGMRLQTEGEYEKAAEKYEEALRLSDMKIGEEEIDLAYYKASAQYRSGDLKGALDTYSAVLAVRGDENSYLGRGLLYMAAGEAKKAEKDLNKALKETKDPLVQGIIYNAVGDTKQAKKCFEQAKSDGQAEAGYYLAAIYEDAGDHSYAMTLLEEYIDSGQAEAEGYLNVGRYCFGDGEYQRALETFRAGIALGESGVLKNLLQEEIACMEKLGDFAGAKEKAAAYLDKYPGDTLMEREYEFLQTR